MKVSMDRRKLMVVYEFALEVYVAAVIDRQRSPTSLNADDWKVLSQRVEDANNGCARLKNLILSSSRPLQIHESDWSGVGGQSDCR
jgi:hypothetical protein